ncbi:MAG TPA: L-aspartate oxidase [Candidatus Sulfotelmatobacter sp.]|nr:L-aspartate oxidase [Candidatus Sulfotelmatobacter sp.]
MSDPDVLIIGSGIAGLMLALKSARFGDVRVVSKRRAEESSTNWAQGGIAAVFETGDTFADHIRDTLRCGGSLSDPRVVRRVVEQAPACVDELADLGVPFNRARHGFALGREGGHSHRRIVHASDFTGAAIERVLLDRVQSHPRIELLEDQLAVDLILESRLRGRRAARDGDTCWGAYVMDRTTSRIRPMTARVTALATGGCGKVYLYTTNPDVATGDGLAMAFRAGLPIADVEFVQFHPTCLYHPRERSFLLSEALRGEGAVLRTLGGERFMKRYHRQAELAPRDVVARAIDREMKRRGEPHVFLDISHRPAALIRRRFPNIDARLRALGFDLTRDPIPVVPAAHYMCGGVVAELTGRTSMRGLLALGEVARTGLHGANRLASNSLLEALVSAREAAGEVARRLAETSRAPRAEAWRTRGTRPALEAVVFDHDWDAVRRAMWDLVGIVRSDQRLSAARRLLDLLGEEIERDYDRLLLGPDLIELRNITQVGRLIVEAARRRSESRGLHETLDHPGSRRSWAGRSIVLSRGSNGELRARLATLRARDL